MHSTQIGASLLDHGAPPKQSRLVPPGEIQPAPRPRLPLDAYRAAAALLRDHQDAGAPSIFEGPPVASTGSLDWCLDPAVPTAVVLAGHAGAGSTTVALAVAEGLADRASVQLVDCSEPLRCGLGAASVAELGNDEWGWRHGRRGGLDLARRADSWQPAGPPRRGESSRFRPKVRLVDVGMNVASALPGLGADGAEDTDLVVVTRLTIPAVRQTEVVLTLLDRPVLIAALGRYTQRRALPPLGPRLRRAVAAGLLVRVPWDRRLATEGLSADPLPAAVARAGSALARRLSLWAMPAIEPELATAAEPRP